MHLNASDASCGRLIWRHQYSHSSVAGTATGGQQLSYLGLMGYAPGTNTWQGITWNCKVLAGPS